MSVLTTSQRDSIEELEAGEGRKPYGSGTVEPAENNTAMDKVISDAVDKHYRADDPEPDKRGLDEIISTNYDRAEAKQAEARDFDTSRESRYRLAARYGRYEGSSLSKTIDLFVKAVQELKQNPTGAAQKIAASYLAASPYALQENDGLPGDTKPEEKFHDSDWRARDHRKSVDRMDAIIGDAIENSGREKAEFKETEAQRAALKEIFPHLSFSQALEKIVKIDGDLHRDPLTAAATLGAQFGMPVLPHQHQAKAELDHLSNVVDAMAPHLPGIERGDVQEKVTHVLTRPDFVRSGNPAHDLARAHAVVAHIERQHAELGGWAQAEIEKLPPDLARMTEHVLLNDKTYRSRAAENINARPFADREAPRVNFGIAVGIAEQRLASLAKAKRAGRVASSTGSNPRGGNSGGSGLDRAIADAMRSWVIKFRGSLKTHASFWLSVKA